MMRDFRGLTPIFHTELELTLLMAVPVHPACGGPRGPRRFPGLCG